MWQLILFKFTNVLLLASHTSSPCLPYPLNHMHLLASGWWHPSCHQYLMFWWAVLIWNSASHTSRMLHYFLIHLSVVGAWTIISCLFSCLITCGLPSSSHSELTMKGKIRKGKESKKRMSLIYAEKWEIVCKMIGSGKTKHCPEVQHQWVDCARHL